jgi:hypothetical protein
MKSRACALKEWCGVIDAMGEGRQIIMMRKYPPAHDEFFLYPTYGFSKRRNYLDSYFQEQHHDLVTRSVKSKEKGRTEIRYYALIDEVVQIRREDFGKLKNLSQFYIWSPDHVMNYVKDEKVKRAFIWAVRVYRLSKSQSIKDLGRGGVKYVYLPTRIFTAGSVPILGDTEFQSLKTEIKRTLEGPRPPEDELKKLRAELREKEEEIKDLRLQVLTCVFCGSKLPSRQALREHIRKELLQPRTVDEIISSLEEAEHIGWEQFEYNLYRAFRELIGERNVKWSGEIKAGEPRGAGAGKPDLVIVAPLAGEPYTAVIEGTKASRTYRYRQTDEVVAAQDHARKVNADYVLLVAPSFTNRAVREAKAKTVLLSTIDGLVEVLKYHTAVGGITQEELRHLLNLASGEDPPQIDNAFGEWKKAVDKQRKMLSLAIEVYNVVYAERDWFYSVLEVHKRLKKKRSEEGRPIPDEITTQTIRNMLQILSMLGAIRFNGEGRWCKASLSREGFLLRIRKLEELVRRNMVEPTFGRERGKLSNYV